MNAFINFVIYDGMLLLSLFFGVTFLVMLLQQYTSTKQLTAKMAAAPLGLSNVYAAVGGAITPFCSCSTIPVLSGMLRTGLRFGVCFTFLMASPLMNEAVIIVMWKYFGIQYLISFVLLALLLPIVFGMLFDYLRLGKYVHQQARQDDLEKFSVDGDEALAASLPWKTRLRFAAIMSGHETRGVLPHLLVGLIIGGLIYGFVPVEFIEWLSNNLNEVQLIILMALLGIPFYFNLVTVIPIAFALTEKGIGLGPVTAFLVAGAGTSLPELILLWRMFRSQLMAAYVSAMVFTAIAMGLLFLILDFT